MKCLINNLFSQKKAISPIVAITLLLIVVVVAVSSFQNWYGFFQSEKLSDVEVARDLALADDLEVNALIGGNLYLMGSVEIQSVKINGDDCFVSGLTDSGINTLPIANCAKEGKNDIVIVTNQGVVSRKLLLEDYNYTNPCPQGYIMVPGNIKLGTKNFCVMKYEAKWDGVGTITNPALGYCGNSNDYNISTGCPTDGSIGIISKADSPPLTEVNQFEAIKLCKTQGSNYHLITNTEWMTIVRNIETVSSNWANGIIGSTVADGGGLKGGNKGILDSTSYDGPNPDYGIGRNTKALLNLTNNEGIWDLSGNVWGWTNNVLDCSGGYPCINMPYDSLLTSGRIEFTSINTYGSLNYDLIRPTNQGWNSTYGVGTLYNDNDLSYPNDGTWNTQHVFQRGGGWLSGNQGGIFSLAVDFSPSVAFSGGGFRCTYSP